MSVLLRRVRILVRYGCLEHPERLKNTYHRTLLLPIKAEVYP